MPEKKQSTEERKLRGKEKPQNNKELIEELKAQYGAQFVETMLVNLRDVDPESVYDAFTAELVNRASMSEFDAVAIERRKQEVAIIKEEVLIFREIRRLISSVNDRYRNIAELSPIKRNKED